MNQNAEKGSARPSTKTYALAGLAGIAALLLWMLSSAGGVNEGNTSTFEVIRGDFLVSVTAGGTLEAVNQEVIRNEVDGTSRVIYIIPEGEVVKSGDLLVELDSAEAVEKVNQQKLSFESAVQTFEAAKANLEIEQSRVQSLIDTAILNTNFAYIDYRKFSEGDRLQQLRNAEILIQQAEESLKLNQNQLYWSQRLFDQGFEAKTNLERDQMAVTNGLLSLEKAKTEFKMLELYDLPKLDETYVSA